MPKVAVITPYYNETIEIVRDCHESVMRQTYPCTHVLIADGLPKAEIDVWQADHIVLPKSHHDIGSTPRLIGCFHAIGLNYDAVAFLDADNWYRDDHIEILVSLFKETNAGFLSTTRMLCRPDGSVLGQCHLTNPDTFIDTSCMMVTRGGFFVLSQWVLMPRYAHLIGDRAMLYYIKKANVLRTHSWTPSVFYRCGKEGIYHYFKEPIPKGVQPAPDYRSSFDRWVEDGYPALI